MLSMVVMSLSVAEATERAECSREMVSTLTKNSAIMIATIAPNPEYNFLPIVITKSLHSRDRETAGLRVPLLAVRILELEFDNLDSLFRARLEFPFLDRVNRGRGEHWASAHDLGAADFAVGGDGDFHFDFSAD